MTKQNGAADQDIVFLADVRSLLITADEQQAGGLWSKFTETSEGFLQGRAVVTNVGVFPYRMADGTMQWQLRPPEEVFHPDSLASLKLKVLTNEHPKVEVTADNAKDLQVGALGSEVVTDALRVSVPIVITAKDAVEAVRKGKRALSCGYTARLDKAPGVWMGVPYDVVQRDIRYNHVALVTKGRAGDDAVLRMDGADVPVAYLDEEAPQPAKQPDPKPAEVVQADSLGSVNTRKVTDKVRAFLDFNPNQHPGTGQFTSGKGVGAPGKMTPGKELALGGQNVTYEGPGSIPQKVRVKNEKGEVVEVYRKRLGPRAGGEAPAAPAKPAKPAKPAAPKTTPAKPAAPKEAPAAPAPAGVGTPGTVFMRGKPGGLHDAAHGEVQQDGN